MNNQLPILDENQLKDAPADLISELFTLLAEQLPQSQIAVNKAIADNNFKETHELLHKLQGTCVYCGLLRLKKATIELDQAIKQEKFSQELSDQFNNEITAVMAELKRLKLV